MDTGNPPFRTPYGAPWVHTEEYIIATNTQEDTTHSAAPRKSIHSSTPKNHMDATGTDKQNITSKHHTILLYAVIRRHAQASPEAGAT
jgi:hypothetical protein